MNIQLLRTASETNRVEKTYSHIKTVEGNLNQSCSVINPSINFAYDSSIINANYAYIPDFGRFYFINDMIIDGKIIEVSMHSDVLMNASADIKNAEGTIIRSNQVTNYVEDPLVISTLEHFTQFRKLGEIPISSTGNYILCLGGTTSTQGGNS